MVLSMSNHLPGRKARKTPVSNQGRSVVDYVDEAELRQALQTITPQGIAKNDWILPVPDPDAQEQTLEKELARLKTLQSYLLLDADPDPALDKLTQEAREIFGVPTSLISLVDLGRQYLFSNTGADVRETPRDVAFCSHTILNKSEDGVLVVEDTHKDARFEKNPLVTEGPKLRFYAGASLMSPEGQRLGTFCVEGPEPRSFGEQDKQKLKQYAATAMALMVQRRKELRDRLSVMGMVGPDDAQNHWFRHAAVTTNLGDAMFQGGDSVTAMQLFQESIQTILKAPSSSGEASSKEAAQPSQKEQERHDRMVDLLRQMKVDNKYLKYEHIDTTPATPQKKELMSQIKNLFDSPDSSDVNPPAETSLPGYSGMHPHDGIPGLFNTLTKLKGVSSPRPLPPLVFDETFLIDMSGTDEKDACQGKLQDFPIDERPFTVSMGENSKATLFNMGLIHYYWCRPDTALQFFHLAASVSHKFSPLKFDPVDLCSMNNMAQIHLLLRKPDEAMAMLNETLKRGNATLEAMYKSIELKSAEVKSQGQEDSSSSIRNGQETNTNGTKQTQKEYDREAEAEAEELAQLMEEEENDESARKTRRLRRKLARTLLEIAHVHFFNSELDKAMSRCRESITLVDDHMSGVTLAAAWYNLSLVLHHKGQNNEALSCLENFCRVVTSNRLIDNDHVQFGDAHQLKGAMLFDLGHYQECIAPLKEALRIRRLQFGSNSGILVETLGLLGKSYLALQEVDSAIDALTQCISIELSLASLDTTMSETSDVLNSNGKRTRPSSDSDKTMTSHQSLTLEAAQTMLDLGRAYQTKGDLRAARQQYEQVQDWAKAFFGADHTFPARIAGLLDKISQQQQGINSTPTAASSLVAH